MQKMYYKYFSCIILMTFLFNYYLTSYTFQKEITIDNSILEWNNALLRDKKQDLVNREEKIKYYTKIIRDTFIKGGKSIEALDMRSFATDNNLYDFFMVVSDSNHEKINIGFEEQVEISWNDINIQFNCDSEKHLFLLINNLNKLPTIVLRSMDIKNIDGDGINVHLSLRNYYLNQSSNI